VGKSRLYIWLVPIKDVETQYRGGGDEARELKRGGGIGGSFLLWPWIRFLQGGRGKSLVQTSRLAGRGESRRVELRLGGGGGKLVFVLLWEGGGSWGQS